MRTRAYIAAITVAGLALAACGSDDKVTAGFSAPADGDRVAGGVDLELTADGVTIEEAGEVHDGAGHFHVLADSGCLDEGEAIAKDSDHLHLGKGQSEGTIYLEPGEHELCVQVGDGEHHALDVTKTISVQVGIDDLEEWCGVIEEVDGMFQVTDNSSDDFPTKQIAYENIRRLMAQLDESLDLVDAAERDNVSTSFEFVASFLTAFIDAEEASDAEEALQAIFSDPSSEEKLQAAAPWIEEECGVAIND